MFPIEELEEIVEWKHLTRWQKVKVFVVPVLMGIVAAAIVSACILFQKI